MKDGVPDTFYPKSRKAWRQWLAKNHKKKQSIWLICYRQKSNVPTITWSDAVDEALCFGWIDSTRKPIDDEKFMQYFSKRKVKSVWSKINKDKIERLLSEGLMTKAGLDSVDAARKNGAWSTLDAVEELKIPAQLTLEFRGQPKAKKYFLSLSTTDKKNILRWIAMAKRPETTTRRIAEVVELAAQNLKPKQFR